MINFQFIRKNSVYFLLLSCLLILSSTLVIEYVFNFPPCELCLYQRIPYGLILIVGLILLFFNQRKLFFLIFILMQFVTLYNITLANFNVIISLLLITFTYAILKTNEK